VNRDGVPDFIVGAWWDDDNGPGSGSATIFSGARLGLSSKTYMLALSSTDSQVFALNAGAEHGGKDYHLLGTLAGTEPGLTLGNHVLPLNLDGYFFFTYLNPNAPPLTDSRGKLDLAGKASAKFTVFTGMPAWLIGLPMHHAYAVITPSVEYTSNPVSVVFTP